MKNRWQLLKDGKVDLHAGLFRTPELEEFLDYSEQLLALDYYIFTHPSVYPIKSLEKTSGFIVGIQKGGYTEQFVRSKVPANRIAVYDRFQDLLRAALEGEIKVFVATGAEPVLLPQRKFPDQHLRKRSRSTAVLPGVLHGNKKRKPGADSTGQ